VGVVIAVDAMGGDSAPLSVVEGVRAAVDSAELSVLLVGDETVLRPLVDGHPRIELRHASSVVPQDAEPAEAVRGDDSASIVVAARAVKAGEAQALVSAGHSGATLAAAALIIGRAPGISRPGLAAVLPGAVRPTVLIDAGANLDTTPQQLHQFAHLGTAFAEHLLGIDAPTCGLLAIGEEPGKGDARMKEAHALLADDVALAYRGSVEGRDALTSLVDVIVTDGFAGNVLLKTCEGTAREAFRRVRAEATGLRGQLGGLLLRPGLRRVRDTLDPDTYGGAHLLGANAVTIVVHGSARPHGIAQACRYAAEGVERDLIGAISTRVS
jgi:glycerol-3-phosphate acyltransferase PlsX